MREDCRHFASRSYDDGEIARCCVLDLAPEAPWRCPENCATYAPTVIDGTFVKGTLVRPDVEAEPDEAPDAISDLFDDAERIIDHAELDVLRQLGQEEHPSQRRRWWHRSRNRPEDDDGEDWHLSRR